VKTLHKRLQSCRKSTKRNFYAGCAVTISAGNAINLEAPKISGSSLNVNAGTTNPDGKINLIAAIDSREVSRTVTSRNTFWQSNESIGSLNQTLHMTNINVPANNTNFQAAGGISVQLPKGAKLPQQIATLAKQPGNEYLTDLAKRSDIDWKQVEVINKTWDYKKAGITQETAIVVAIVVTIFTAGAGASLLGAATGTTVAAGTVTAAVANAALTTLATQSAIALLNNKGDVSGALKELGSKENVKNLAIAMVTAGVLQGMGNELGLVSGGKATLLQNLQTNLINGVASSLITTAINGGSLEDSLKNAVKNAVISAIASQGANAIGDLELDKFSSNLAHAFLGCAVGSATAGSSSGCAAGAGGAVVGHLSAEWYGDKIGIKNLEGDALKQAALDVASFAKLTTAIAGLAGGANAMNIAGVTSTNAVANNYLNHIELKDKLALQKVKDEACKTPGSAACNTATQNLNKIISLDEGRDKMLKESCTGASANEAMCNFYKADAANAANSIDLLKFKGVDAVAAAAEKRQTYQLINNTPNALDQPTKDKINTSVTGVGLITLGVASGGTAPLLIRGGGALLGSGINAGMQNYLDPTKPIDWLDVGIAGLTGGITMGAGLPSTVLTNVGGSIAGSGIKGEDATAGATGTAVGSVVGYGIGNKVIEPIAKKINTPWYRPDWVSAGSYGVLKPNPPLAAPVIAGGVASGTTQEPIADYWKKKYSDWVKP
jgi:hypothetical protein